MNGPWICVALLGNLGGGGGGGSCMPVLGGAEGGGGGGRYAPPAEACRWPGCCHGLCWPGVTGVPLLYCSCDGTFCMLTFACGSA